MVCRPRTPPGCVSVFAFRGMQRGGSPKGEALRKGRNDRASQAFPEMKKEVTGNSLGPERKFFSIPVSYCCRTNTSKLSDLKHSIPFVSPVYMEAEEFCFLDQA